MSTIGIIGYGYVGRSVEYGFVDYDRERGFEPKHHAIVYDKYKGPYDLHGLLRKSDIIFACLPTPYDEQKLKIDLSIYDDMMAVICPKLAGKGKVGHAPNRHEGNSAGQGVPLCGASASLQRLVRRSTTASQYLIAIKAPAPIDRHTPTP